MTKLTAKHVLREVTPPFLLSLGRSMFKRNGESKTAVHPKGASTGSKGTKYLQYARDFSESLGGEAIAFERGLNELISSKDNSAGRINQEMLVAFSPHYKQHLFEYYQNQQFNLLFRFLQYPFIHPTLAPYIEPYARGIDQLDRVDLLDYGCGIPYGLLECLETPRRAKINSITLVDLDLLHMKFTKYLLNRLAPEIKLTVHLQRDTEAFPTLVGTYNMINGKDIFEHLAEPEQKLRKVVAHAAARSVCFFDFADRGKVIHQHISPLLSPLHAVMTELGYRKTGELGRITELTRDSK